MRVVQITDLHIVPKPNTKLYGLDPFVALERVLTAAFSKDRPDLIIATGDLVEDGSMASYKRLRALLLTTDIPVFVLPGNHDSIENMSATLVGKNIHMLSEYAQDGWQFAFLNSQVTGHGHGELKAEELETLEVALRDNPDTHFLLALHHTPLTPCPYAGCRLDGRDALSDLAETYQNLRCIISGHAHEDRQESWGSAPVFTTPSTSAQCWHAQEGESSNPDSFWASHYFDPNKSAFRRIELLSDGHVTSQVEWLSNSSSTPD